jgi:hypothetical protein
MAATGWTVVFAALPVKLKRTPREVTFLPLIIDTDIINPFSRSKCSHFRVTNLRYRPKAGEQWIHVCKDELTAYRDADNFIVGIRYGNVDVGRKIFAAQRRCKVLVPGQQLVLDALCVEDNLHVICVVINIKLVANSRIRTSQAKEEKLLTFRWP